jgi:hypothetical protein
MEVAKKEGILIGYTYMYQKKGNPISDCLFDSGDPNGIRTRITGVRGGWHDFQDVAERHESIVNTDYSKKRWGRFWGGFSLFVTFFSGKPPQKPPHLEA